MGEKRNMYRLLVGKPGGKETTRKTIYGTEAYSAITKIV
jgi:hypothetical protein